MNNGFQSFSTPDRPARRMILKCTTTTDIPPPTWTREGMLLFVNNLTQLYRCNGIEWEEVAFPFGN